jgi:hypothetical protein
MMYVLTINDSHNSFLPITSHSYSYLYRLYPMEYVLHKIPMAPSPRKPLARTSACVWPGSSAETVEDETQTFQKYHGLYGDTMGISWFNGDLMEFNGDFIWLVVDLARKMMEWVRQLGWWNSQDMESHNPVMNWFRRGWNRIFGTFECRYYGWVGDEIWWNHIFGYLWDLRMGVFDCVWRMGFLCPI